MNIGVYLYKNDTLGEYVDYVFFISKNSGIAYCVTNCLGKKPEKNKDIWKFNQLSITKECDRWIKDGMYRQIK